MSITLRGTGASAGIAVGPVHLLRWEVPIVPARAVTAADIPRELERIEHAYASAAERLRRVRARAEQYAGAEEAAIFDVQISILNDPELRTQITDTVHRLFAAEQAVDLVLVEWRRRFARHDHAMLRERVGDLVDVQIRLLSILMGLPDHDPVDVAKGSNAILVTRDLTPSLTVQLDREAIAAIATEEGTRTSHVAILARSLGLPAIVGLRGGSQLRGGERAILDGTTGVLIAEPSGDELADALAHAQQERVESEALAATAAADAVTGDGALILLRANVDLPEAADSAVRSGAEGVGLMRTEFLVVGRTAMPDEDEQYAEYAKVASAFAGRPVVIRTYDIGGDKLPVGGYPSDPNPFLGWRAIRMCLDEPDLFKVQLRALLRAAVHGDVRVLLPLVNSVEEVRATRALLREAAAELDARGTAYRADLPLGVMIETPAAAINAESFVRDVAFFSIGTNDLTQYTLAVDRGNANLAPRFEPLHPAVLRLIQGCVTVGRTHGLDVAVCGEMASDPLSAFALIGLGLRQLSVAPRAVPRMKRLIRSIRASVAQAAVADALCCETGAAAESLLRTALDHELAHHA